MASGGAAFDVNEHDHNDSRRRTMTTYESRPTFVEAIQHTGEVTNPWALNKFAPGKVRIDPATGSLELLAGKDGAQDWVPVPVGHWLVHQPNDLSDIWPVDPDYFAAKYDLPEAKVTSAPVTRG